MSVINFGPLAPVAPGIQQTTRGFEAGELPAHFVYEAREFLKTKRRGMHQFDKRAFLSWLSLPGHPVRFSAKAHADSLYDRLIHEIKREDNLDRGAYPARQAAIYEGLLSIIYDINKDFFISPEGVLDALRNEIALHGDRAHLGPTEPSFEELAFAVWAWNANLWNDHVTVGEKDMLIAAYNKIESTHHDLIYPFAATYEDALSALEETEDDFEVELGDIDHLAKFFVRLHPPRHAEGEFFETPYDVVLQRHALAMPVIHEHETVEVTAPPPPVESSTIDKKRKGRADWQWDEVTRQRALEWVNVKVGENVKSIPAHLSADFVEACVQASPPWITETVEVKSACQQLLTHVRSKLSNDYATKKKKAAAAAAAPPPYPLE
jgi:hypothetical protein